MAIKGTDTSINKSSVNAAYIALLKAEKDFAEIYDVYSPAIARIRDFEDTSADEETKELLMNHEKTSRETIEATRQMLTSTRNLLNSRLERSISNESKNAASREAVSEKSAQVKSRLAKR